MKINNYSRATGEYLDQDDARESPREPGQPLIPAYSTPDEVPIVGVGYVAVYLDAAGNVPGDYRKGTWSEVLDQRGMYYRTADGLPEYLTDIGANPTARGLTSLVPPNNAKWSGDQWEVDQDKVKALNNASLRMQIAAIEQTEQPAAQRDFVLTGNSASMRNVQDKIDLLAAQIEN